MVIVGVGECLHTIVLMPLVADLAPAALRGRYMAVTGLSWWLGLALAPMLAPQLMGISPPATMLAAAAVAAGRCPGRSGARTTHPGGDSPYARPRPAVADARSAAAPAAAEMG
jgi:MFS family permease